MVDLEVLVEQVLAVSEYPHRSRTGVANTRNFLSDVTKAELKAQGQAGRIPRYPGQGLDSWLRVFPGP